MSQFSLSKSVAIIAVMALLVVGFFQRDALAKLLTNLANSTPLQGVLDLAYKQELFPAPLHFNGSSSGGELTRAGVIEQTNNERTQFGLAPLHENSKLNQDAELKLSDMFEKQYFEHESPDGKGPSDLADKVGYKYLVVGENLAEGAFQNDKDLVQAWMDSPGHRANILHDKFQEIGVAVGKGEFEGKTVWLAVQSFGAPASLCPGPSPETQKKINANKEQIEILKSEADTAKAKKDINKYNSIATELNQLISETQTLVKQYNSTVDSYNSCLEEKS